MNLLVDSLPTAVRVDGVEYELNSDFRYALRIFMAFEDNELAGLEKNLFMITHLYKVLPKNVEVAVQKALQFLNCGVEASHEDPGRRLFSYQKDAPFIFAAFRQTHNIDLETVEMHFWKFMALFMDLGETTFTSLVSLRKRVFSNQASKEERKAALELGDVFTVPEIKSSEDIEVERLFYDKIGRAHG